MKLTETQNKVLTKLRKEGTKNFTRSEYRTLRTIKQNCKYLVFNWYDASKLLQEIERIQEV